MNTQDNDPLHAKINTKLAEIVATAAVPPPWYPGWMALGPHSTEEERLKVYQAIRDSGDLPADAGFYLVSWQIDAMASTTAEEDLRELDEALTAVERSHGLEEGEFWEPDEAPEEYEELHAKYMDAWDDIFADKLAEFGEHEMAEQFAADPDAFDRRSDAGKGFFYGPEESEKSELPTGLRTLAESVMECMKTDGPPGTMGLRYREEDGVWDLVVYLLPIEIVGGAADGEIMAQNFALDMEELAASTLGVEGYRFGSCRTTLATLLRRKIRPHFARNRRRSQLFAKAAFSGKFMADMVLRDIGSRTLRSRRLQARILSVLRRRS